jgi:hypothetical protein
MITSIGKRLLHPASLLFLLLWFFSLTANAQNSIVTGEYFFDKDPGVGSGVGITLTSNTTISASQVASVSGLSLGKHVVYVRLKSQGGNWGAPVGTAVTVSEPTIGKLNITQAEYFFDADPGTGLGQSLSLAPGPAIALQQDVSTMGLNRGRHTIDVRLKDSFGLWSAPLGCNFLITDSSGYRFIRQAEYFFDRDPGQGQGNFLPVSGALSFQNVTTTASTAGFSVSNHQLFVRFLDDKACWGPAVGVSFRVAKNTYISGAEFFIDSLGLPGKGRAMSALDTVFDSTSEYAVARVDTSSVHAGYHTVFVQVQSSDGRWSSIAKDSLLFGKVLKIVESDSVVVPKKFNLAQNYPNPFNPSTIISYDIPRLSRVTLIIYDILGRQVATLVNEEKRPGSYRMAFDGSGLASGVYFYQLQAGTYSNTKKLLLLK